jgi:hypothetical protein
MARSELMDEDRRPLWRSAAIEIAAAGGSASAIGAAIKENVLNKRGSLTRH